MVVGRHRGSVSQASGAMGGGGGSWRGRLAHGWKLWAGNSVSPTLITAFVRPAVRAIPPAMARQLGFCRVHIADALDNPTVTSRWTAAAGQLEVEIASGGHAEHDVALELLVSLGQALWTKVADDQRRAYWLLVDGEIRAGTSGEIDEEALRQKRALLRGRFSAASRTRLEHYGSASFAGTAAEYIHSLWHDVSIRSGPEFLPAKDLKRRLQLLACWYPPARGYHLFSPPE